jgi:hypothetical protein
VKGCVVLVMAWTRVEAGLFRFKVQSPDFFGFPAASSC